MERQPRIRLTPTELKSYSHDIRVILHVAPDKSYYLRQLSQREMTEDSFVFSDNRKFLASEVDYEKLTQVADVAMCHKFLDEGSFDPKYEEVIRQIPERYKEEICAFEIMYAPSDDDDLYAFTEMVHEGYHVFVVRLYARRRVEDAPAPSPFDYPKGASVPEGMDDSEFAYIQAMRFSQWYS